MKLYYFPDRISTYCQKALLAFEEKGAAFTPVHVDLRDAQARAEFEKLTPIGKVPLLVLDDGWKIPETSIIIEYLENHAPGGTQLIPEDPDRARQTRFHDRIIDLYINDSLVKIFSDSRKPEHKRDPDGVALAHKRLDSLLTGYDAHLGKRTWLMGDAFTMADCALVACFYLMRQLHPYDPWKHLTAYANRAFERPSYSAIEAHWVDELPAAKTAAS